MPLNFSSALFFFLHWIVYWKKRACKNMYFLSALKIHLPPLIWSSSPGHTLIWNQGYCQLQQASFSTIPRRNKRLQTAHFNRNLRFSWPPIKILHMEKQSFKVHHAAGENTFYRYNVFSLLRSRFVSSKRLCRRPYRFGKKMILKFSFFWPLKEGSSV